MSIDAKEQRRPHRDQYFYVLDYLPGGSPAESRQPHGREPVAQVIGEEYFTLLEVVPLEGIAIKTGDRIFVGRGPEDRLYSQFHGWFAQSPIVIFQWWPKGSLKTYLR
jgi:Predicted RNA-binding protein